MDDHRVPAFTNESIEQDITYFEERLKFTYDSASRERIIKQLAVLDDALVLYKETQLYKYGESKLES